MVSMGANKRCYDTQVSEQSVFGLTGLMCSGYCFYVFNGKLAKFIGLGLNAKESAYHHHHHFMNKGNFSAPWLDALLGTQDDWLDAGMTEGYINRLEEKRVRDANKRKT